MARPEKCRPRFYQLRRCKKAAGRRLQLLFVCILSALLISLDLQRAPSTTFAPDGSRRVLVTGAAGYLGRELCCQLYEQGWHVTACVRDTGSPRAEELATLLAGIQTAASEDHPDFQVVALDVIDLSAASALVRKVRPEVVMHAAAVFRQSDDPVREIVEPNMRGVENIVQACASADRPLVLILTSSMAAVRAPGQAFRYGSDCYDHLDLNPVSSPPEAEAGWHAAYSYSKAASERHAWELAKVASVPLLVLCPSAIIGPERRIPSRAPRQFAWMQIPEWMQQPAGSMLTVDVRDAALAHVRAAERSSEASGERIILSVEAEAPIAALAEAFRKLTTQDLEKTDAERLALELFSSSAACRSVACATRLRALLGAECRAVHHTMVDTAKDYIAYQRHSAENSLTSAAGNLFGGLFAR